MDDITIRPATPRDVPALSALAKRTWSAAFGHSVSRADEALELERTRFDDYFVHALLEHPVLVAEVAGELVGYVEFGDVDIPDVEARTGDQSVHRVYVDTALQGRGLGRRLMGAALRHPRLAHARHIYLTVWEQNDRALRLYERLGFERVGTTAFTIGARTIAEDLVMRLDQG